MLILILCCAKQANGQGGFNVQLQALTNSTQCANPSSLYRNPNTGVIYASCNFGGIISIAGTSITTLATAVQCPAAANVYSEINSGTIYAACSGGNGGIISIVGTTITTLATPVQCPSASSVHGNPITGILYSTCSDRVISIAGNTVTVIATADQCANPVRVFSDPTTNTVYVACRGSIGGVIAIVGTTITTIATPSQCPNATSVFLDTKSSTLYLTCYGDGGGVLAMSNGILTTIATTTQCSNPWSVSTDSITGAVLVACYGSGGVIAIVGSTVTTLATSMQCPIPVSVISDSTSAVVVACLDGSILSLRTTTVTTVGTLGQCTSPRKVYSDPLTGMVLAACYTTGVIAIRGTSVTTLATAAQCPGAYSVHYNPSIEVAYAACRGGGIIAIPLNGTSVTMIATSTQCSSPVGVWSDVTTGKVIAVCAFSGTISISGTTVTTIATGLQCQSPSNVYMSPSSGVIYLTCSGSGGSIVSITGTNVTTVASSAQCPGAYSIFGNPATDVIYAACSSNNGGGIISIVGSTITSLATSVQCPTVSSVTSNLATGVIYASCTGSGNNLLGSVIAIDGSTVSSLVTTSQCANPTSLSSNSLTGMVYVACFSNNGGILAVSIDQSCPPAYYFANVKGYGCSPCVPGRYRNYAMQIARIASCSSCADGSVMPVAGGMQCDVCPPSMYAASAALPCFNCSNGWYSSQYGSTSCSLCQGGYYGSGPSINSTCSGACQAGYWCSAGSTTPTQIPCGSRSVFCPSGSSSPVSASLGSWTTSSMDGSEQTMAEQRVCMTGQYCDGSGVAKLCVPGTYQNQVNQSTCLPCGAGTVSSAGASNCTACPNGHTSLAESSVCTPCAPGSYLNISSALCVDCPIGRFSAAASINCTDCPPGQIASTVGSSYCEVCDPGSRPRPDPATGILVCTRCPAGSASQGGAPCSICSPGRFASSEGSFACTLCAQGTSSNVTGLTTSCPPCGPGTYQSSSGQSTCLTCGSQHYSSSEGAVACQFCSAQVTPNRTQCVIQACPVNHVYSSDDSQCSPCPLGSGSNGVAACQICEADYYTPAPGSSCMSCSGIEGLECSGGLASVKQDYWAYLLPADQSGVQLYATARCAPGYCPGSRLQLSNRTMAEAAAEIVYCEFPRLNAPSNSLCGQCVPGFIPWGDKCVECSGVNNKLLIGLLVLSFALSLFLLRSGGTAAGSVTVLLYFVQIAALEIGDVSLWFSWLHVFNFKANSISTCLAPWDPYDQLIFAIIVVPLLLIGEMFVIACIHLVLHNCFHAMSPASGETTNRSHRLFAKLVGTFSWDTYVGGAMSVLLFCYTQVATSCMQFLYCTRVGDELVVFTAPTVDCQSPTYRKYLVLVIVELVVFIIGFPLAMVILLWRHKSALSLSLQRTDLNEHTLAIFRRWGPLFAMYEARDAWCWQPLILVRRGLFALISALLIQRPAVSFMLFAIIHFLSLQLHIVVQPYGLPLLNRADTISNGLLVLISVLLTGFQPAPYPIYVQAIVLILIAVPVSGWVMIIVRQQWFELQQKKLHQRPSSVEMQSIVSSTKDEQVLTISPLVEALDEGLKMNDDSVKAVEAESCTQAKEELLAATPATSDSTRL